MRRTSFLFLLPLSTRICIAVACLFASAQILRAADATISAARLDATGILTHDVESPFQAGKTSIRVLLPTKRNPDERFPVIYVLPVEARDESRYGNGLAEILKHDLHNKHRAVFVAPTFSHLPWYADHPTNELIRQESYFINVVVPFIDKTYPVKTDRDGRHLLGFSKSGWGAWTLPLRHPDRFGNAAAWDAPLNKDKPNQFGMGDIFGTQENFEKYQVTKLIASQAEKLGPEPRLILLGYDNFRDHHEVVRKQLLDLKIPHIYRDGPKRQHIWGSGWVPEAVELLLPTSP